MVVSPIRDRVRSRHIQQMIRRMNIILLIINVLVLTAILVVFV